MCDTVVLNEFLAFVQSQRDVIDEASIAQICIANFTEDEIKCAKSQLYRSLCIPDLTPHRQNEKGDRCLQDIFRVFKETEGDDMPLFVAKDLRKLPAVTFNIVDVARLRRDIASLTTSLAEMEMKFEESQSTISDLRDEVLALRNSISLCRSPETSNVNTRRGAHRAINASFESAKSDSSPAADLVHSPRPACPVPEPMTSSVVTITSSPRNYAAAAASHSSELRPSKDVVRGCGKTSAPLPRKKPAELRKSQPDKDGFTVVERKKKRKPPCQNKCGTGPTGVNLPLRPAVPSTQLYVSRLHHSTKASDVVEYMRVKTQFTLRVEQLESRNNMNFNSFVVRVPTHHLPTFMNEEFWPKGVVFRRFRGRLRHTQPPNLTLRNK